MDEARQVEEVEREIRTLEIPSNIEDGLRVEVFDVWQVIPETPVYEDVHLSLPLLLRTQCLVPQTLLRVELLG